MNCLFLIPRGKFPQACSKMYSSKHSLLSTGRAIHLHFKSHTAGNWKIIRRFVYISLLFQSSNHYNNKVLSSIHRDKMSNRKYGHIRYSEDWISNNIVLREGNKSNFEVQYFRKCRRQTAGKGVLVTYLFFLVLKSKIIRLSRETMPWKQFGSLLDLGMNWNTEFLK